MDFSDISADGQWLLAVVSNPGPSTGRTDVMPRFVTQSGYVEAEDVRRLVGRNANEPQQLWLLDLTNRARYPIDLTTLSGLSEDPLADLKAVESIEPHSEEDPRPLRVIGLDWHPEHNTAAIMLRAIDNKDRWLVTLDTTDRKLVERHRLTDAAWINWSFNQFGWIPGQAATPALWLLSEQTGYSHLYTIDLARNRLRQRTDGDFEVFDIQWSLDGRTVWMLSNRSHPTEYDLYRLTSTDRNMQRLTELRGLESYQLHPLTQQVAIRFSRSYLPAQAGVLDAGHQQLMVQTDTRTDNYRAIEWQLPQIVGIESKHGAERAIWSKFYPARDHLAPDQLRPAVLFVHGAGYLQNTHHRYPAYFREQMFHNLLTAKGYHVLDMDFRASRGYGRDWRTAIYRQMGTPELEDLLDGVQWLVDQHNVDPARIGVYGGSYGGFMAFMAMFKAPKVFAAGAALRPVTDWTHYNHGYTSNILNTPQIDPEAYRRSSPIEFAEHLEGHLLISHGMLDDNVFYKDSVRLAQRLIELEKEHWELASYPMEPHGYIQPSSWLDQYRRILSLFETTIGPAHSSPQPAR
ncbi:MAG: alpha/beta fold hydrolase [Pseudomonadota bacterium]